MVFESRIYLAGIGFSPVKSSREIVVPSLVSAATKALLDAGITHDDVSRSVTSEGDIGSDAAKAFDGGIVAVDQVGKGSELATSFKLVKNEGAQCVLMLAEDEFAAVTLIIVSEAFLWTRPYLKDSAALVNAIPLNQDYQTEKRLSDFCQLVWATRAWSKVQSSIARQGRFCYEGQKSQCFELRRADEKNIPQWKEIEHRQDGRHRLGYNPTVETRDIFMEEFEAVKASSIVSNKAAEWTRFRRKGGDTAALSRL